MKKAESELNDWGRSEYKRSDLGELVRGKYAKRRNENSNIVVLDPEVAEVFPNSGAVNKALRSLISTKRRPPLNPRSEPNEKKPQQLGNLALRNNDKMLKRGRLEGRQTRVVTRAHMHSEELETIDFC